MAAPKQLHEKTCHACGTEFTTHKAKAKRCQTCIDEGRRAKTTKCVMCDRQFPNFDEVRHACYACEDRRSPEEIAEALSEQLERLEAERRRQRWINRSRAMIAALDAADRKRAKELNRMESMSERTAKLPIGVLWLSMCHADGAAHSTAGAARTDLSEDDVLTLVTTFHRLRAKGYPAPEIAKLCPKALLKEAPQVSLTELPKVDQSDPDLTWSQQQEREAEAAMLGWAFDNQPNPTPQEQELIR